MALSVTTSLFISFCVTFLCVFGWRVARFLRLAHKIPGPTLWELLTVHWKPLMSATMHNYLWKLSAKYEYKPWCFWIYKEFVIVVSDSEVIGEVYNTRALEDKPGLFYDGSIPYTGNNLLTLNGAQHRSNRKALNPAFQISKLKAHQERINYEALKFVERLSETANSEELEVIPMVDEVVGATVMSSYSSGTFPYEEIPHIARSLALGVREIQIRTTNPFYYWMVHQFKRSTRAKESEIMKKIAAAKDVFLRVKHETAQAIIDNSVIIPKNYLEILAQHPSDRFEDEGYSETLMYFAAGVDTTAATLNIALVLLAMHPDVQEKIFQEMESIFGQSDRHVEVQDLSAMVYLDMAMKETLRLFPPAPAILKRAGTEVNINGIVVPAGAVILINTLALHRNPQNFKDPLKYNPSRFSPDRSRGRHPYAFAPFSSGPRNCPGQHLGLMVLKTNVCHVVRNFKILLTEKLDRVEDIKTELHFTAQLTESPLRFVSRR